MNASDTSPLDDRPIREMLYSEADEPLEGNDIDDDKRLCPRYPRRLPGKLIIDGIAHPITYLAISCGGLRVVTPNVMKIPTGTRIKTRFRIGLRVFEDEYTIAHGSQGPNGMTFHLGL